LSKGRQLTYANALLRRAKHILDPSRADDPEWRDQRERLLQQIKAYEHSDDAPASPLWQMRRIQDLASEIGRHWRDQGGVNGALLDQLAELTKGLP
jgi:hypothetical protein